MTGSLTGGAASTLLSSGSGLLGTALGGYNQQANMSEEQMKNWQSSLFGGALTGGLGIGLKYLSGKVGGGGSGGNGMTMVDPSDPSYNG